MVSKLKSMYKSIVWRIIGVVYLFSISYIFTRSIPVSTYITLVHHAVFLIVFWLHERAWLKKPDFKLKPLIKGFTYEIVIAIPIMLVISFIFTQSWLAAVSISLTYTLSKVILYAVYDKYCFRPVIYMDMVGDLFHVGHLNAIREASKYGKVIVGVVVDKFVNTYKRKPVIPFLQRKEIIQSIKGVDKVVTQWNLTTAVLARMRQYHADYFLHGDDWKKGTQKERRDFLLSSGIKIIEIPYTFKVSTSKIITKIQKGGILI